MCILVAARNGWKGMIFLFVLQNGYHSEKYHYRNNEEWHDDLHRSFTGKRLCEMMPDNAKLFVIEASTNIGNCADSCFPADIEHIQRKIAQYKPDVICGCGKIAQSGLEQLGVPYISLPHPAWRHLSKDISASIKRKLELIASNGERNE
jgi:hypothetical protein